MIDSVQGPGEEVARAVEVVINIVQQSVVVLGLHLDVIGQRLQVGTLVGQTVVILTILSLHYVLRGSIVSHFEVAFLGLQKKM